MKQDMNNSLSKALRAVFAGTLMFMTWPNAMAQGDTQPTPTVHGNVYGGGNMADVKTNTEVNMAGGTVEGNVYGGGNLGDVGTIYKDAKDENNKLTYNYVWRNSDANGNVNDTGHNNTAGNNTITGTNKNTGICKVNITGGTIGTQDGTTADHASGNVFGAGKGSSSTWWCEKASAFATNVSVSGNTVVYGTVYGGGEVGRVEDDAKVTIGTATDTGEGTKPDIKGDVFGAGAGVETHGYSALVRGNATLTVQGIAQIRGSVYGGGEIASVGRFTVVKGLPTKPETGGTCIVNIKDNAKIGTSGTGHNVFGACKGVTPHYDLSNHKSVYSMQTYENRPSETPDDTWDYYVTYPDGYTGQKFIKRYYTSEEDYLAFLKTLALTSHPHVTIGGTWTPNETTGAITASVNTPSVYGSVYGGGQRGVTLGNVDVNMVGGTVEQDVYGGGALADTNLGNWDVNGYVVATALNEGESITDLYERSGAGTAENPYKYTKITDSGTTFSSGTYYRQEATWAHTEGSAFYTTSVDLTGGTIKGDAYGGGLGQKTGFNDAQGNIATKDVEAVVWGDIAITLGSSSSTATSFYTTYEKDNDNNDVLKSGRVFGCNNLLGSPRGDVTVTVWTTVDGKNAAGETITKTDVSKKNSTTETDHTYRLAAVYGGGNLASYEASGKKAHVIIHGCENTSILTVYGGGNAAAVPETDVDVYSAYEIGSLFGGGNGKDKYKKGNTWLINPGADVNGNANTMVYGGTVHEAYGASNEKGTITGDVAIDVSNVNSDNCPLDVAKIVGAGKNADVNGNLILVMGCKPSTLIPLVYGGADNANVNGNVELTITSGNFTKVFGGNNAGGAIRGYIKLNIEETGSCETPITIDQLYLGGNEAAYSIYGYYIKTEETEAENGTGTGASTETAILSNGRLQFMPRQSASDTHLPVDTYTFDEANNKWTWTTSAIDAFTPYSQPKLNVISCTRINNVFGGGFGTGATMYADPTVNINMIQGHFYNDNTKGVPHVMSELGLASSENPNGLGVIGDVFGGGNAAKIEGSTTVNIGTATTVNLTSIPDDDNTNNVDESLATVKGAYIVGNVYGGGNEADVTGNTFVNICAKKETDGTYTSVASDVKITSKTVNGEKVGGNVYGGGKGKADTFTCEKAMIGEDGKGLNADYTDGNTNVVIGNGIIDGTVYGGGEIGRVERNTTVTIGLGNGEATGTPPTSAPEINGNVFGAGAGEEEHGYAALVRGNPTVTIQGNAKIGKSVYGGGEIASVARYKVAETVEEATEHGVAVDMPYVLESSDYGHCKVTIGGYAEIGPDNMKMYHTNVAADKDAPDDAGHVFGAGRGVLPKVYAAYGENNNGPRRMVLADDKTTSIWQYFANEEKYFEFIRTLALATETEVTIGDHAFIKGSVYGGSENGIVQFDTYVTIQDHCQIGQGKEITTRYEDYTDGNLFELTAPPVKSVSGSETVYYDLECASWDYGSDTNDDGKKDLFAPYDPNANATGDLDKYPAVGTATAKSTEGGRRIATDGHTFYGNVFGGGSGSVPYFDTTKGVSRYIMSAGWVKGNTNVTISGGHILTNVYGGNEATNVDGTATVTMTGGTIGVPRTLAQIDAHPVTCYLFGAGKGDQRVFFNKDTNVKDVVVNITGGRIFGSVFGGGEDGHVLRDVTMTIGTQTTTGEGAQATTTTSGPTIGTWGTSYVDGNVFGGGRGFGGDAYTAGNVAGSVTMNINGGTMLGSIYGGGRLGSVGYGLFDETTNGHPTPGYGKMRADEDIETGFSAEGFFTNGRGHIDITISGGTIGNDYEYIVPNSSNIPNTITQTDISKWTPENWTAWKAHNHIPKTEFDASGRLTHTKGGNVFAGGMGRQTQLDGQTPISAINWWQLGCVKQTKLTITGGHIKSNVYGGGELGAVIFASGSTTEGGTTEIDISGSAVIGTPVTESVTTGEGESAQTKDVPRYTFGSVYGGGMGNETDKTSSDDEARIGGLVKGSTTITLSGGEVKGSVYGGGELAIVQGSHTAKNSKNEDMSVGTEINISGGTIGYNQDGFGGATMGNVYGAGKGSLETQQAGLIKSNTLINISGGNIYHNIYGGGAYGSVGTFTYETPSGSTQPASTPSGCTEGTGTAWINITGGNIGINGHENGMVFGSSRGDVAHPDATTGEDPNNKLAWVKNTYVTIGTSAGSNSTPWIMGSVYGSGENGHVLTNTDVTIHDGKIGIEEYDGATYDITSGNTTYKGAAYPSRGNVYGGGCGTDTYAVTTGTGDDAVTKYYFNRSAGIVRGNSTITMDGGQVVRTIYGGGAMGSIGKFTRTPKVESDPYYSDSHVPGIVSSCAENTGLATVSISGGTVGPKKDTTIPDGAGNVFGASRGEIHDATEYPNLERMVFVDNTAVTISEPATVKGSVYGGSEAGHVLTATNVSMTGGSVDQNIYGGGNLGDVGLYTTDAGGANIYATGKGVCQVSISGGTVTGNVFGAGKGEGTTFTCEKAMVNSTTVTVENGTVNGNVYGGGEVGRVESNTVVTIGKADDDSSAPDIKGSVFGAGAGLETHGYSALVRGNTTVTVQGSAKVGENVYGGGKTASVGRYGLDAEKMPSILLGGGECAVTIGGNAVIGQGGTGNVFGACKGVDPHFDKDNADKTLRSRRMTMYNATEFLDADKGTKWEYYAEGSPYVWEYYQDEAFYTKYLETLALATRPTVTIKGSAGVNGSVYGGGERGITKGTVVVNIEGGTVAEDVYGGGALANTNTTKLVGVFDENGIPKKNGAGQYETTEMHPTTKVNLTGGTIARNVYGGGLGRLTKAAVAAQEAQGVEGEEGYVPAVEAQDAVEPIAAKVYGNVLVELNKTTDTDNCVVKGNIFGCNNLNGSPQAGVTVHVYKTADYAGHEKDASKSNSKFNVNAVYGGGNLAAFYPDDATTRATAKANVIIEGCNLTSIGTVYGGGNAASVPETDVVINSAYEIGQAFGGGNGADDVSYDGGVTYVTNPGANVGYLPYSSDSEKTGKEYGRGKAHVTILGGTVHAVYGGSNTRGNIRVESRATLRDDGDCEFNVAEAYGGGRNALQDGDAVLDVDCISGLGKAYGGASNADVNGDVKLNITNGTYGQVFGGNDAGGCIRGSITVNVDETGCRPVIIGELYGGGNQAAYSVYGYNGDGTVKTSGEAVKSPVVNVRSFTSIGKIFGGGFGNSATMVGDPTVNINVVKGKYENDERTVIDEGARVVGSHVQTNVDAAGYDDGYPIPSHAKNAIGAIQDVFGGGNAAEVIGNPKVNVGTEAGDEVYVAVTPAAGTDVASYFERSGEEGAYTYSPATGTADGNATYYQKQTVSVDIRGNVYGGGNNAVVTGNTEVVIGKKTND